MLADTAFGDPRRGHPVAAFGRAAAVAERCWWADSRSRGALHTAACVLPVVVAGSLVERWAATRPLGHALVVAVSTWAVLGGRSLAAEARAVGACLEAGQVDEARRRLPALCGRDPSLLSGPELARAAVESVAENTSDAVVAPLLWGALAGVPGLLGYRAVNTLDAMVGHRTARHERFGWASARLDDVANLAPARLTAAAVAVVAPTVGGSPRRALGTWRRDGGRHPSPNAGPVEAAAAGALGVRLGGVSTYGGRTEVRGPLGSGPRPGAADVRRAVRLCRNAVAVVLAVLSAHGLARAGARR